MNRNTRQRQAIRDVLARAGRPLSPQEILHAAHEQHPALGIATVYRTINYLRESGDLNPVELPGEIPRYELSGKGHHHHFHCLRCNRVFDIHKCATDFEEMIPEGFDLERHVVILYGTCSECLAAEQQ